MAALLMAPGAADAFQATDSPDIRQESANVKFRLTSQPHANATKGDDWVAPPVFGMVMTVQLADNLSLLFDKFGQSEFILCLEGELTGEGELELTDFRMPHIAYSRPTSAAVHPDGGCDQYEEIVGTLHNHPGTFPKDFGREDSNCYLSHLDITSWLEYSEYPYTAVMCGPKTWAWWHRTQVDPEAMLAWPDRDQLVKGTGADEKVN